jgi:hypothetical protein
MLNFEALRGVLFRCNDDSQLAQLFRLPIAAFRLQVLNGTLLGLLHPCLISSDFRLQRSPGCSWIETTGRQPRTLRKEADLSSAGLPIRRFSPPYSSGGGPVHRRIHHKTGPSVSGVSFCFFLPISSLFESSVAEHDFTRNFRDAETLLYLMSMHLVL